jgi:hypothetical protein
LDRLFLASVVGVAAGVSPTPVKPGALVALADAVTEPVNPLGEYREGTVCSNLVE